MQRFRVGERVCLKVNEDCTGVVVFFQSDGFQVYPKLMAIQWDYEEQVTPQWYRVDEIMRIPDYPTPPPMIIKEQESMSQAIWCDKGDHAFSAKDPGREHYTSTRNVTEGSRVTQRTVEMDICGRCMSETKFYEVPAIAGQTVQDQVPTKDQ